MTLTDKERESIDAYFVRRDLGRLWENLKLLITFDCEITRFSFITFNILAFEIFINRICSTFI